MKKRYVNFEIVVLKYNCRIVFKKAGGAFVCQVSAGDIGMWSYNWEAEND